MVINKYYNVTAGILSVTDSGTQGMVVLFAVGAVSRRYQKSRSQSHRSYIYIVQGKGELPRCHPVSRVGAPKGKVPLEQPALQYLETLHSKRLSKAPNIGAIIRYLATGATSANR